MAAQLYAVLNHYKQEDPIGFPGAPVPDPMDVPDMKKNLGMATLSMYDVQSYGLSKFRIVSIKADLNAMTVRTHTHSYKFEKLKLCANYNYLNLISKTAKYIFKSGYQGKRSRNSQLTFSFQ